MHDPDVVIAIDRATVTRSRTDLVRDVSWRVELDERWVILGPNGAGKTTLLNLASARLYPTRGTVHVLGEKLGRVNINELRTRLGLTTAALQLPAEETAHNIVLTASWSVVGRFRESYDAVAVYGDHGPRVVGPGETPRHRSIVADQPRSRPRFPFVL